jgi:hypothetical protein
MLVLGRVIFKDILMIYFFNLFLGIIKEAIKLTIYSPDCPDLTKIPLSNSDQPGNIEELTKSLAAELN